MAKLGRICLVVFVNVLVLLGLFILTETADRIYHDGFRGAFVNLVRYSNVPYSNLGTRNWVIYDAELGYRLNPGQRGINSLSLREREVTIPKPHGLYRVVVLGDSIPWDRGGFVELMSARRADQPQFEIINASVPGYTSYQELVFFKRYLLNAEPDVVIWSYCLNDNHKFLSQFDEKGRMLLTPEAEETLTIHNKWEFLVSHSYLLSSLWFRIVALRQQYRNQNRSEFVWEKLADFNVAWKEVYWSSYEKYVSEMLHVLNERNAKLAIVVFPFEPQLNYRHDASNYDYAVKPQRILHGICEKYHIPCLDLYPTFSAAYDEGQKFYRDGIHLNNAGHHLTASTIERFLTANDLLPEVPR